MSGVLRLPLAVLAPTLSADQRLQALLDPRRLVRWGYVARLALASAIFLAAIFVWQRAASMDTLIASVAFVVTAAATVASAFYSEVSRRPLGRAFFYAQSLIDLLLVTAVVHVTGGGSSQFAALYILVIVSAALVLPTGGNLLVALAGCLIYFADVFLLHDSPAGLPLLLQLGVFGVVAGGSALVGARLREAGVGSAELAAELVKVRVQAADILHNIRSGILTVDTDGTLLYANPAAATMLGLPLAQRLGRPVLADVARVAPQLARALERAAHHGERVSRGEATITTGDRVSSIGLATTTTAATGGASGATAIFQDISDHKRLESLHLRAERLEAVAELSASLAHEIKNPLASIRSAVEQLAAMPALAGVGGAGDDDDTSTLTRLIVRESDRLSRLLSEFLDFARVRVTQITSVDVAAVARDAVGLASAHPERREGVAVMCTTPEHPVILEGDHDLLHRAVFNLTLNAVQAAPASGRVTVEVTELSVDQTPSGLSFDRGAVALRVTDDGPGIPEEVRESLFEPFITTKPGGSGLGLPIVHRAVEAHTGVVLVDSGPTGTRFTVLLPLRQAE